MEPDEIPRNDSAKDRVPNERTVDPFGTVDSQQHSANRTLGGYRLLAQLGSGGMGVVYEADSLETGHKVALKTLQSGTAEMLTRLKSEFRVLTDLAHPNLVRLGELNTTDDEPFFTMEIVRGVAFNDYVAASLESVAAIPALPYNDQRLRDSLLQLASGLDALHSAGLVHRDVKPSNVMVTHDGRVVVLDMGLAAEAETLATPGVTGSVAGTPYYMAPEQMRGLLVTSASDWYAVGVMLFEALTGERLFRARSANDLLSEKLNDRRLRPSDILPEVASDLSNLCERLLSGDPEMRPRGGEVLELLSGTVINRADASTWIGREGELTELRHAWEKVLQGSPQVVFVSGASGIGKTSLIDQFLTDLRQRQPIVVLRGRCYENEAVPYRGFDSIVDALGNHLQRLPRSEVERVLPLDLDVLCQVFPILRGVNAIAQQLRPTAEPKFEDYNSTAQDLGQRGVAALRELLCRLARFESVVLFIDDLQQGDQDTAAVFREIFRSGQAPALLCLGTFRSEDAATSACLRKIRRKLLSTAEQLLLVEQRELNVDRLPDKDAEMLAFTLLRENLAKRDIYARRIAREAGGDPLFIRMLAEDRNRLKPTGSSLEVDEITLSLRSVIEKRVLRLQTRERRAVEFLATAGRPLDATDLETIVGGRMDSVGLIRVLRIQKLVKRLGDRSRIELYHDKIRETALAMIPDTRRSKYCLRMANHLESAKTGLDVEFLADLYRRGGDLSRAGFYYQQSADIANAAFAFNRAIECYRYAIEFLDPGDQREAGLRKKLGDALANASRSAEAAMEYLTAAELVTPERKPQLQQLAALRLLTSGHVNTGIATLRKVLTFHRLPWPGNKFTAIAGLLARNAKLQCDSLRPRTDRSPDDDQRDILDACWAAAAGLSLVDPLRGSFYVSETLIRSMRWGAIETLPRDLSAFMGQCAIGGSRSRRTIRRILIANRRLQTDGRSDSYKKAMLLMSRGIAALLRGEWSKTLKCCDRAVQYLSAPDCYGKTWELNTSRTFALWALQYQGNLKELAKRQPALLNAAIEADDLFATLNFGTQVTAHLRLAADRPDEALNSLQQDYGRLSDRGFFVQHHNQVLASTYTRLYLRQYEQALETIEGQWLKYQQAFLSKIQQVRIDHHQVLARTLLAAAKQGIDRGGNLKRVGRIISQLRAERVGWADAFAMMFEAACQSIEGKGDRGREKLQRAACMFDKVSMNLFSTAVRSHLAEQESQIAKQVEASWEKCGVKNGEKMAMMLAPGL